MFTVESRFSTSPDSSVFSWVKKGEKLYIQTNKFSVSFMVWEGIFGDQKTRLLTCPDRLKAQGYVQLLDENWIVAFLHQRNQNAIFQQDGARFTRAPSQNVGSKT